MLKKINISDEYPEHFRKAIEQIRLKDGYDFSTTELLKPLQAIHLANKYDYEIDGLKNTAALLGTAFHFFMEHQKVHDESDYILEKRYFKKIGPYIISGQPDVYCKSQKTIWDYKTASMYKVAKIVNGGNILKDGRDWVVQTNAYKWLSEVDCKHIKIMAVIKDFKYRNHYKIKDPAIVIELPILTNKSIERWLVKRIDKIKNVLETGEYPECTDDEIWNGTFCRDWCDVNSVCEQFNSKVA